MASIRSCSVTMPCTSPYSSMTKAMCTSDSRKLSSSSMPVMVSGTYSAVCKGWSSSVLLGVAQRATTIGGH